MPSKGILKTLIGDFQWVPPLWLRALLKLLRKHLKLILGVSLVFLATTFATVFYFKSLPLKVQITANFSSIKFPSTNANAKPSNLLIDFIYDAESLKDLKNPPTGNPSVAKIDLVGKTLESGIQITPNKAGIWRWSDDNTLKFTPETEWPAGTNYKIKFDPSVLTKNTILSSKLTDVKTHFSTPDFSTRVTRFKFVQDPTNSEVRQVLATVTFSHPVDKASFEKAIKLNMQTQKVFNTSTASKHDFIVTYHKDLYEAYIQSAPVTLPKESNYMRLNLEKGINSLLGGNSLKREVEAKVLIPDVYSYLKINETAHIVRNSDNEPEQILTLSFTDDIEEKELFSKLAIYQLPKKFKGSLSKVDNSIIQQSQQQPLKLIPNKKSASKTFNFQLDIDEKRDIYFKINEQLNSVNGFIHKSKHHSILSAPKYPKEVKISGEGSVLSYNGNHQIGISSRGIHSLNYKVGKLLPNKVNHFISQTRGDIKNPEFTNWQFSEDDLLEYEETSVKLSGTHQKKANYSAFDLSEYLPKKHDRFGLFFVNVKGMDEKNHHELASDKRVILITDLGIIVKDNADQSHHIFVQSIESGLPVNGAKVELLGKNGVAISSGITDENGHLLLPTTKTLKNEKTPTVYVVKTANDMSFIPFKRSERQINLSKFDIGGISLSSLQSTQLNGFLFNDRGIYRPGETVNLGIIVKNSDLSNIENIPLELIIRGPKNKLLTKHRYQLPKMGFSEFQFPTETVSDTGIYKAALYLVGENNYRGAQIGSTSFKVEEFQPDTMKIVSQVLGADKTAWNTKEKITAAVTLTNLFGTPAQDRKVTAKAIITPSVFDFPEFENYRFTETTFDSSTNTEQVVKLNKTLLEKQTDADGKVSYDIDLTKFTKGTYQLNFSVEGFEQNGGRSVYAENTVLFSPLKRIIGYKPNGNLNYIHANSQRKVNFISVDNNLKQETVAGLLLKKIEVQHISTLTKQANGEYQYQTIKKEVPLSEDKIDFPKTGYDYTIDSSRAGNFALEILDGTGQRLSRLEYTIAGFADLSGKIDKSAELALKLDKKNYLPGETIKMSLKAPYIGNGLITIETDKVEKFKWFNTTQESSIQEIDLPKHLEGTAYINVSFVRDISSKEIFTSPLSYAVKPFSIDKSRRNVNINLTLNKLVRPGKPLDIKFKASKDSKVVVFAIDEGILQVADYKTPDPLSHYLKKRALDVRTSQILDLILPDFNLKKLVSAAGGGSRARNALAKNLNPFARKLDKPAIFWSGIYPAKTDEEQQVNFEIPNTFAGELRVMAVAVANESVGAHSQSTTVRGPFVISPNVLSSAAPGDEFDVTVGVANIIEGSGKNANILLSAESSDHVKIIGDTQKELKIDEGSEGKATFKVKAIKKLGAAELKFTAQHKKESLSRSASFSIRPASHYRTEINTGFSKRKQTKLDVNRTLFSDLAKQHISASSSPLVLVEGLNTYLENYPHQCTEQAVSKVFPQVGLLSHPSYATNTKGVKEQFDNVLTKLRSRQTSDGGFAFWPGHNTSSVYPTIYAMHFLIEAQSFGYPVPKDMLNQGARFLKSVAQNSAQTNRGRSTNSIDAFRERANAIYLLTRQGNITSNYLIDLEENLSKTKNLNWKNDILSSYMAATYQLLQNQDSANKLIKYYELNKEKDYELGDFHSLLSLDAQYIYLLAKHFKSRAKRIKQDSIIAFTDKIRQGNYNTISSAYAVLALGAISQLTLDQDADSNISFSRLDMQAAVSELNSSNTPFTNAVYPNETKQLTINAETPIFYSHVQSGFDNALSTQSIKQGIEIYREYLDEKGNSITTLEQGKEVLVKLKVRALNNRPVNNVAIVDLLPGGFEIIRSSVPRVFSGRRYDYVDVREDRLIYYTNIGTQVTEISYRAKLTSSGVFTIPAATAESMYDRSTKAVTATGQFTVTKSQ